MSIVENIGAKLLTGWNSVFNAFTILNGPSFHERVALGLVPGWSIERKFGSIDAIQAATPADAWEYGITPLAELYTWSETNIAAITHISSSSASDTVIMTIIGLDETGAEVIQTKALQGQTKVELGTPLNRFNRMFNSNGVDLVGDVYCYEDDTISGGIPTTVTKVRGYVSAGEGQTLQANYTVPLGKTGLFYGLDPSLTKGTGATAVTAHLRGRTREHGGVFRTQDAFNLQSHGSSSKPTNFPFPLPFAARTDFCPRVEVSANGMGASWAFFILLKDD